MPNYCYQAKVKYPLYCDKKFKHLNYHNQPSTGRRHRSMLFIKVRYLQKEMNRKTVLYVKKIIT